ncbi:DUF6059 family protein [Couchioplanes caeruleus]|uniref:Uncharacterized protein n=2 Tax=Couchioplanes caeruleus TaxID=56438 RepID=A0A1K0F9N0_9ACTN|nr:DUF6059 family protein [Couchioplanes caeruleus]OJF09565.1 hypothetical protein BG844_36955 [Couchioplanes caeruleus subsp. caeruleus]OJF16184.1 hypothetical protein BG844_00730 [Couchioplanes caeruleus subsp. caeruleus]ROP34081.1 hypothetical protein EDD30_7148 [Couchioplanes caeruleus]
MDATEPLRRCGRLAVAVLRWAWRGFGMYGMAVTGVQPSSVDRARRPPAPERPPADTPTDRPQQPLAGPPPGHPERLLPGVPLDPIEIGLWRQLH